jgi:hypothetical protein
MATVNSDRSVALGQLGLSGPDSDPRDLTDPGDLSNLA